MTVKLSQQQILAELKRRHEQQLKEESLPLFDFKNFTFPAQYEFFRGSGGRFRSAVCSRRAGKTVGIAADMIDTCQTEDGVTCLYITLSKRNARNIIWGDIEKIIKEYELDVKVNQVELSVVFKNGSKICIEGAKDKAEIEKYRGWKVRKVYLDEAQSFRPYIKELINDILIPALRDLRGQLYLTGTPGPVPAGYFYETTKSSTWYNRHWTAFDNPHMHMPPELDLNETLAEERVMKGISEADPSYRRETYGEWIEDTDALVYKYNEAVNNFSELPAGKYVYIMGVDIGYEDADAICILAYSKDHKEVYLVEEFVKPKQTISQLAQVITELDEEYQCIKKVIDAGALGKKITEEIIQRYGITLEAADKKRKIEFIELMNSDLRKGIFKIKKNSIAAEESKLIQWDTDRSTPDKLKISDTVHSDIWDAILYAYREARHYLYEAPKTIHHRNTDAYMKQLEEEEAEAMEAKKDPNNLIMLNESDIMEYEQLMDDFDSF